MVLHSRDDPICIYEDVPRSDLLNNDNCLFIESDFGGHCDFLSEYEEKGEKKFKKYFPNIAVKYFDDVAQFEKSVKK